MQREASFGIVNTKPGPGLCRSIRSPIHELLWYASARMFQATALQSTLMLAGYITCSAWVLSYFRKPWASLKSYLRLLSPLSPDFARILQSSRPTNREGTSSPPTPSPPSPLRRRTRP
jgi:hypothetical protein